MPQWILAPTTASLRYRTLLALAIISFGAGVAASLTWVYVIYNTELAERDLKVIAAVLILMLALTAASLLMARFAKKRIRTLTNSK